MTDDKGFLDAYSSIYKKDDENLKEEPITATILATKAAMAAKGALAAGKAAYLAKQLKNKDHSAIEKFNGQDISKLEITGELNFLNKLKKSRDKAAFFYWYKALN